MPWFRSMVDSFVTLFCVDSDVMRVVGPAPRGGDFLEIVLDEAPLRQAMLRYSWTILLLSLFISATQAIFISDFSSAPSGQDVWAGIRPPAGV